MKALFLILCAGLVLAGRGRREESKVLMPGDDSAGLVHPVIQGGRVSSESGLTLPLEPTMFNPANHGADPTSDELVNGLSLDSDGDATNVVVDPELLKLNDALESVKEDIVSTSHQIKTERDWVLNVQKFVTDYTDKIGKTQEHVVLLRSDMQKLFEKKKQIENLKLQRQLEAKLTDAQAEMDKLKDSYSHIKVKQGQLHQSHDDLSSTIATIKAQIAELQGEAPAAAEQEEKDDIDHQDKFDEMVDGTEEGITAVVDNGDGAAGDEEDDGAI